MSSANNKDNGSLEASFRHRMQDAEATPAPDIWSRINHDLIVQENIQYKKRIIFYRQLAAACFLLFILAGSILAYQFNHLADKVASQESTKATASDPVFSTKPVDKKDNTIASSRATQNEHLKRIVTSANADQSDLTIERLKEERQAANKSELAQFTAQEEKLVSPVTNSENREANTDFTFSNKLLADSDGVQKSVLSDEQSRNPGRIVKLPISSSMLTIEESNGTLALHNKFEVQNQTTALAQELNKDLKETNRTDKAPGRSRWDMSVAYTPTYFDQNISVSNPFNSNSKMDGIARTPSFSEKSSANLEKALNEYENNTTPVYSFALAIKAGFHVGKKLKLLAGIGFTQNTARSNTNYIVEQLWEGQKASRMATPAPAPITVFQKSLSSGFTTDSISIAETDQYHVDHRYRMLSFPIGLQYEDGITNGWNWYITGGLATNIMLESSIASSRQDIADVTFNEHDESPFRYTQFSGNAGIGVSKQVTDAVSIALGPEFRGFLNSMLSDSGNSQVSQGKPYALGLNMSLSYQLGR